MNNKKYGDIILMIYKSERKNSKGDMISIHDLITSSGENLTDERILHQIVDALATIVAQSKKYNSVLILSANVWTIRKQKKQAINGICEFFDAVHYHFDRRKFYSIEQVINYLWTLVMLMYPYCTLSEETIHLDSSIRYFISKYYDNKEEKNQCISTIKNR